MADHSTRARVVDAIFVAALLGLGVVAHRYIANPAIPDDVCVASIDQGPRYAELLADHQITVAAVFGEIRDGGPFDSATRSVVALSDALRSRGYTETAPHHFELNELAIDITQLPHDDALVGRTLTDAFATHELVYYNGHSDHGDVPFSAPADTYRIALLDTCYGTQVFSSRLVDPARDVISNSSRSVTGSAISLLVVLDALHARAPTWQPLLDDLNTRAASRARLRAPLSRYKAPEHYRLDARCKSS